MDNKINTKNAVKRVHGGKFYLMDSDIHVKVEYELSSGGTDKLSVSVSSWKKLEGDRKSFDKAKAYQLDKRIMILLEENLPEIFRELDEMTLRPS